MLPTTVGSTATVITISVPGHVYHLWHGSFGSRHYEQRHELLERLAFDPGRHLEPHQNGTWRWTAEADSLKKAVSDYFLSRLEDGEPVVE